MFVPINENITSQYRIKMHQHKQILAKLFLKYLFYLLAQFCFRMIGITGYPNHYSFCKLQCLFGSKFIEMLNLRNKDSQQDAIGQNEVKIEAFQTSHIQSKHQFQIQKVIRLKNSQKINPEAFKLQNYYGQKLKALNRKGKNHCHICEEETELTTDMFIADCPHKHIFCQSCLHQYAIYCIEQFNKVLCPNSGCTKQIDTQGLFFKSLPSKIQLKYSRVHRTYQTYEDPSIRMCLRENCEGIIKVTSNETLRKCSICESQFCPKCQLQLHQGSCQQFQQSFFAKTLRYRQCKHCHTVIQKFKGRNQMSCACDYQFCYVCGSDWMPSHCLTHNQKGVIDPQALHDFQVKQQRQSQQASKNKCCWIATLVPRLILALILYSLFISLFAFVIIALICASSAKRVKTKEFAGKCMDQICERYFQLYTKVWDKLIIC